MKRIAVVTSSPPQTEGGHLVIARALTRALGESGYDASLFITPDYGFGRNLSTYWANRRTDVGGVDQVISLRYPSYAIPRRPHVCWLNHTIREYYDLWPRFSAGLSTMNGVKERVRRIGIRTADTWLLRNVDRVVAQSGTIRRRLADDFRIAADVVWPPAPPRPYRTDGYGDYVLAVSRLVPLKRIDLVVRALAEPNAQRVRAVVIGDGESRRDLSALADRLGVADRVTFLGRATDAELLDHLAHCRAVCFPPLQEDFGLVTVEAFASAKAVITCRDSGGPSELVDDGVNGFVIDPTPAAMAAALARLFASDDLSARMGIAAKASGDVLSWRKAVERLVIV